MSTNSIGVVLQSTILEGKWHRNEIMASWRARVCGSSKQRLARDQRTDKGNIRLRSKVLFRMDELLSGMGQFPLGM